MSQRQPDQPEARSPPMAENFRHRPRRVAFAIARNSAETSPASSARRKAKTETKSAARFFTPAQHTLVEELSETIIPADSHSGGAKAAKVADYIEQVLRESSDQNRKSIWLEGLRLIDLMSQHYNGKSFVDSSSEERIAVLTVLSDNEQHDRSARGPLLSRSESSRPFSAITPPKSGFTTRWNTRAIEFLRSTSAATIQRPKTT